MFQSSIIKVHSMGVKKLTRDLSKIVQSLDLNSRRKLVPPWKDPSKRPYAYSPNPKFTSNKWSNDISSKLRLEILIQVLSLPLHKTVMWSPMSCRVYRNPYFCVHQISAHISHSFLEMTLPAQRAGKARQVSTKMLTEVRGAERRWIHSPRNRARCAWVCVSAR